MGLAFRSQMFKCLLASTAPASLLSFCLASFARTHHQFSALARLDRHTPYHETTSRFEAALWSPTFEIGGHSMLWGRWEADAFSFCCYSIRV